ncbi:MAG TPA: dockerin type I domain-containing protein, partial [Methanoregulaceae archaeon]|nr:dockerin type I domain-containing protein [Methanoregulaceae archaeon]
GSASGEPCPFDGDGSTSGDVTPFDGDGSTSGDVTPFDGDGSASGEPCPFVRAIPLTDSSQADNADTSDAALLPTDPDNDGLYEDLNGNGRCDFADVVLYFNQMNWIAENEPVSAFDYNGNGEIDFSDLILLFHMV